MVREDREGINEDDIEKAMRNMFLWFISICKWVEEEKGSDALQCVVNGSNDFNSLRHF